MYFKFTTLAITAKYKHVYDTGRHRSSGGQFLTPHRSSAVQPVCHSRL